MLQPKRTKYRKTQKSRNRGLAFAGGTVAFGDFGLKAVTRGQITAREIEAARRAFTRAIQRKGQIFIRVFPDKPIIEKARGVRMGKGKGSVEYWVCPIQPGKVLFELGGIPEDLARHAFELAAAKLSVQTTFVSKAVL